MYQETNGLFMEENDNQEPIASPVHPMVGHVVDSYRIVDLIGAGAMGAVFRASHIVTQREVALKILFSELAKETESVARMLREARALAQLDHVNIVKTFDCGYTQVGEPFLVIEYVKGKTLRDILDSQVLLPPGRAIGLFLQMADAVRAAHKKSILHRDLKPENIMITDSPKEDTLKVLDFGIAHFGAESQRLTRAGEVIGSPVFMSPEQLQGFDLDYKSDIYQLGAIMYQTLTGEWPHQNDNFMETIKLKCSKKAPPFSRVVPGRAIPASLEKIVLRCLEIDPQDRYINITELKNELELVSNALRQTTKLDFPVVKPAPHDLVSDQSSTGTGSSQSFIENPLKLGRVPGFLLEEQGGQAGESSRSAVRRIEPVKTSLFNPNRLKLIGLSALVVGSVAVGSFVLIARIQAGSGSNATVGGSNGSSAGSGSALDVSGQTPAGSINPFGDGSRVSVGSVKAVEANAAPGRDPSDARRDGGDVATQFGSSLKLKTTAGSQIEKAKPELVGLETVKKKGIVDELGAEALKTAEQEEQDENKKKAELEKAKKAKKIAKKRRQRSTRSVARQAPASPEAPVRRRAYSTAQSYYATHGGE